MITTGETVGLAKWIIDGTHVLQKPCCSADVHSHDICT